LADKDAVNVLASFRAVRPRVEPDPLNAKALRQRALVCCKGTLAAMCLHPHPDAGIEPSQSDWETARVDGDMLIGICQIVMRKRVGFRILLQSSTARTG